MIVNLLRGSFGLFVFGIGPTLYALYLLRTQGADAFEGPSFGLRLRALSLDLLALSFSA